MKIFEKILLIPLILILLAFINCQKKNPVASSTTNAPVSFKINFTESAKNFLGGQSSRENINHVTVTITGEGLSNPKNLVLTISNNQATGTINLPFGLKDFYVVASVQDGLIDIPLFSGTNTINITESTNTVFIDLAPIVENEAYFYWHDGSFENTYYSSNQGDMLLAYFIPTEAIFVKEISLHLFWQGNSGDYRIVVIDDYLTTRFRSGNPLSAETDGWISWSLIYTEPVDGILSGGFYAGFEYNSNTEWPEIGYDMSNPTENSKYYDSFQDMWYYMSDGDFAITVTVQTQSGKVYKLKPAKILYPGEKSMAAIDLSK
jgi:hypothetical protein